MEMGFLSFYFNLGKAAISVTYAKVEKEKTINVCLKTREGEGVSTSCNYLERNMCPFHVFCIEEGRIPECKRKEIKALPSVQKICAFFLSHRGRSSEKKEVSFLYLVRRKRGKMKSKIPPARGQVAATSSDLEGKGGYGEAHCLFLQNIKGGGNTQFRALKGESAPP